MDTSKLIADIKARPDYDKVGMILCHNGVVRGTSRDGRKVSGLKVFVDHEKLARVIQQYKKTAGIVEILVDITEEKVLAVGEDVMVLVVAGDIRDTVISVLNDTLNAIKSTVTRKEEFFI